MTNANHKRLRHPAEPFGIIDEFTYQILSIFHESVNKLGGNVGKSVAFIALICDNMYDNAKALIKLKTLWRK